MLVKYPRTLHLPWSPGCSSDDKIQNDLSLIGKVDLVVLEKRDGEVKKNSPTLLYFNEERVSD